LRTPKNGSVAKAFQILNHLAATRREMTATEVAQAIGGNLPTVHRFLITLEEIGAVSRSAQGKFQLGMVLANLGNRVESHKLLVEAAQPHLDALAGRFREVTCCAVQNGGQAISIAHSRPDRALLIGHAIGAMHPLHCSAVGKVLLAGLDPASRTRRIDHLVLTRHTDATLTDAAALARALTIIAQQGFAVDDEEWEEGLRSVAVPLHNGRGGVVAALALSAPASRLNHGEIDDVRLALQAAAERIAHSLFTESRVFPQKARPRGSYPHLKRVDDFIFISGTSARRPDDSFDGVQLLPDGRVIRDITRQTRAVFDNIRDMLAGVQASLDDLVDVQAYLTDMSDYDAFNQVYGEFFGYQGPTRTTVGVSELPHPHQALMVRAVAYAPQSRLFPAQEPL
jgi:DNA-binding IclR family transcriptional regulator